MVPRLFIILSASNPRSTLNAKNLQFKAPSQPVCSEKSGWLHNDTVHPSSSPRPSNSYNKYQTNILNFQNLSFSPNVWTTFVSTWTDFNPAQYDSRETSKEGAHSSLLNLYDISNPFTTFSSPLTRRICLQRNECEGSAFSSPTPQL